MMDSHAVGTLVMRVELCVTTVALLERRAQHTKGRTHRAAEGGVRGAAEVAQFIEPLAHELSDGDAFIRLAGGHRGDSVEAGPPRARPAAARRKRS